MDTSSSSDHDASRTHIGASRALPQADASLPVKTQTSSRLALVSEIDLKLSRILKLAAISATVLVLIVGTLSSIGWAFGIDELKHPNEEPALQAAAAVNFIVLSTALLLLSTGNPRMWRVLTGRFFATVVIVASVAAFGEHTGHFSLGHVVKVTLWPSTRDGGLGLTYPGPLLPHESFPFILLGLGALLFNVVLKKKFFPSQVLALLVFVPSFIIVSCCMLGQSTLCIYFGCVQLTPICSLVFLTYSLGLFFAAPDQGAARIFCLKTTAGIMARRFCAGIAILFVLLLPRQWLIAVGESSKLADASTINIATAIVALLALCSFAWCCFRKIETDDSEKQHALQEKSQVIESMQRQVDSQEQRQYKLLCLTCMSEFQDMSMSICPHDQSPLVSLSDDFRPGTTFDQRYTILQELGTGGMSTVYLAEHLLMNKKVAVKVLQARLASDPTAIQRFQREAQAASSLSHSNLAAVYDFNVTQSGQAYMVMEFLEGQSMSDLLSGDMPLPWRDAVLLLLDICDGVEHAHSKGIVHRDLKPANVMLLPSPTADRQYTPKIVDFGLAKVLDDAAMHLTHTGEIFGSPLYMSPEQCEGKPVDTRSDIYSLGCILFATLVGKPPFQGDSVLQTLMMHIGAPLPAMPANLGVPAWLEEIARKAIAKDPDERFQSVTALIKSLTDGRAKHP